MEFGTKPICINTRGVSYTVLVISWRKWLKMQHLKGICWVMPPIEIERLEIVGFIRYYGCFLACWGKK